MNQLKSLLPQSSNEYDVEMKLLALLLCLVGCSSPNEPVPFTQQVEGTDFSFKMMPVTTQNGTFWISRTEVPWDLYDIFLQFINSPENLYAGVDTVTGPTPAYASVDRGFGRSGYPAISMSAQAADSFCAWLSSRTGKIYSIPTQKQWNESNSLGDTSWNESNSGGTTHPIATTDPNTLGIYDMRGNVGEWVTTNDGPRVIGGSFRTPLEQLGEKTLLKAVREWNITDPQLPRSPWWFADADYVGLRIVTNDGEQDE
jgi:formylglycine-generating enzyme required for sulfatase activity|tara:strand:+ start:883 stop:1653 length:771 start_codon:yes stop_codon:yes gene_type:complete